MLCTNIFLCIISFGYDTISFKDNSQTYMDAAIGVQFKELSPELIDDLHKAKHWEVDNTGGREWMGTPIAPNTDNCFLDTPQCRHDFKHYIYQIPIPEHKGFFYTITFSYNYYILAVNNGWLNAN